MSSGHLRARRLDVHGVAVGEPSALLPARVVRQVHAVPRGHRLAAQDPPPHRGRRGAAAGPRSALEHLGQRGRQDAVRLRRRRGHARADDAETFPARIRGTYQGRALYVAGRLARAAARSGPLKMRPRKRENTKKHTKKTSWVFVTKKHTKKTDFFFVPSCFRGPGSAR